MKVDVTSISEKTKSIHVEIPQDTIEKEMTKMLTELRNGVQVPGFRVGKVPDSILKMRFGKEIRHQIGSKMIESTLFDAIDEAGATLVGSPKFDEWTLSETAPFAFSFTIDVIPDFEVDSYKNISIEKIKPSISEEEIAVRLGRLTQSQSSFEVVSGRNSAQGDRLYAKIHLQIGEETVPGWKNRNVDIALGEGKFFPGSDFEQKLIGLSSGNEHAFEVVFPADYKYYLDFAGKTVNVKCDVKEIKAKQTPQLDDEFARDLGLDSLDQLKQRIQDDLSAEQVTAADRDFRTRLLDKIAAPVVLEIPEFMIEAELDDMNEELKISESDHREELMASLRPLAERKVKLRLILERIAHKEAISVTSEEIDDEIKHALESSDEDRKTIESRLQEPAVRSQVRRSIKRDRAMKVIVDSAAVTEVDRLTDVPENSEAKAQNVNETNELTSES